MPRPVDDRVMALLVHFDSIFYFAELAFEDCLLCLAATDSTLSGSRFLHPLFSVFLKLPKAQWAFSTRRASLRYPHVGVV